MTNDMDIFEGIEVAGVNPEVFYGDNVTVLEEYDVSEHATVRILLNSETKNIYYFVEEPNLKTDISHVDEWYRDVVTREDYTKDYSSFLPLVKNKVNITLENESVLTEDRDKNAEIVREIGERYIRREEQLSVKFQNKLFGLPMNLMKRIDNILNIENENIGENTSLQVYDSDIAEFNRIVHNLDNRESDTTALQVYDNNIDSNENIGKLDKAKNIVKNSLKNNNIIGRVIGEDKKKELDKKVKKKKKQIRDSEYYKKLKRWSVNASHKKVEIPEEIIDDLLYYLERDLIRQRKLQPIFDDDNIEDVHVNASNKPVFIYHSEYGVEGNIMTNIAFGDDELDEYSKSLAQQSGQHISKADPILDGSTSDGSRIHLSYGNEVNVDGSNMTIRFFDDIPLTPIDLIQYETFSAEQMAYMWLLLEHEKSMVIAGGTASGKTTTLNACALFVPDGFKIITLEDTREISLPHLNWTKHITRDASVGDLGEIDMFKLLEGALRERPDYILVGEVRGSEAQTLFQAMNTGHATISTMHAETVDSSVGRLTNNPINVPRNMLEALDIVCIQKKLNRGGNSVRRIMELREVKHIQSNDDIDTQNSYKYDPETDTQKKLYSGDDSAVLADIKEIQGWTNDELKNQLDERKRVLEYLVNKEITDYNDTYDIFQKYMKDSEAVMEVVENRDKDMYNLIKSGGDII